MADANVDGSPIKRVVLVDNAGQPTFSEGVSGTVGVSNLPTTVDTNSGAKSASTLRVTLATDQVQLTNSLLTSSAASATGGASFLNIAAGQATTTVKSGAGTLYAIVLNSAATATNTTIIYDNTAASGTVIGRPAVVTATVPTTLTFGPAGMAFATGLTIITATANGGDMTIVYK